MIRYANRVYTGLTGEDGCTIWKSCSSKCIYMHKVETRIYTYKIVQIDVHNHICIGVYINTYQCVWT